MTRQKLSRRSTLASIGACLVLPAFAQVDAPVRVILPNAVGSGVDAFARSAQHALAKALGHPVIVDNKPGAGGIVGLQALSRSPADGMTLGVVSNNVVILPSVLKSMPLDIPGDITPVAICGYTPVVLVVNPKVRAIHAQELVGLLKARRGDMTYASGGNGTILHLAVEMFLDATDTRARHIPYKGVGPMLTDLISGQVDFATAALPSIQAHLKAGTLRAIGMANTQRAPAAPDIPTFVEQGVPDYVVEAWFAVVAPKNLPAADLERVHAAVVTALNDPEVKEAMARQGNVINVGPAQAAMPFFRAELAKYAALVKKAGVETQ